MEDEVRDKSPRRVKKHVGPYRVIVMVVVAGLFLACGKSTDTPGHEDAGGETVLRFDSSRAFGSLDPMRDSDSGASYAVVLLYSHLFSHNSRGELEPDLAANWTYDSSTLTWTIGLRNEATFHDNKPVTSRDVKYSLEGWLKSGAVYFLPLVERIEAVSEHDLRISLKTDDPQLIEKISHLEIVPLRDGNQADSSNQPVGSGPFKFQYRNGEKEMVLVANEHYYGGRPLLDRVVLTYEPDTEKTWARLLTGQTDVALGINSGDYQMIERYKNRFDFDMNAHERYAIMLYNTKDPLFADPGVRLALSCAVDREYIVRSLLRGFGMVANGPMGVGSPYHNPRVMPVPYDRRRALDLLQKAGWSHGNGRRYLYKNGKCFEFTLLVFEENQDDMSVAEYLRLSLNDLGVKVHLRSLPFDQVVDGYVRNGDFQAVLTELKGAYLEPEILRQIWSPLRGECSAAGCFEDPEVSRLLTEAAREADMDRKKDLYYQVDSLFLSLQPGTFLYHKAMLGVMSKRIKPAFPFSNPFFSIKCFKDASTSRMGDF